MREPTPEAPVEVDPPAIPVQSSETPVQEGPLVEEELLVEDVSIDGMCGVY